MVKNPPCPIQTCSTHPETYQTGGSRQQGPTYWCRVCGYMFWEHDVFPTEEQLDAAEKLYPKYTRIALKDAMTRQVIKRDPPCPSPNLSTGKQRYEATRKKKIEQLGGSNPPSQLRSKKRLYWMLKYFDLYPNCDAAKAYKQEQWDKDNE